MPRLRVHSLVHPEFAEARAWYGERSAPAAENFSALFDRALSKIASQPTAHAPWYAIFRRARLSHYPYLILFHTNRRVTSVLALSHERRDPVNVLKTIRRRLVRFV